MEDSESELEPLCTVVLADHADKRLDQAMALLFPQYSRARLQQWIRAGRVTVDGATRRPRDPVTAGQEIRLAPVVEPMGEAEPEDIELDIVYQDDDILVLDKPAGLVVHPAAGNPTGTLLNGLLHYDPNLALVPRGGIVHRLDKDTTGLMVVARNLTAHKQLVAALQARTVGREYQALVTGVVVAGGRIDAPIGRHPTQRTRMTVLQGGRAATTHYRVAERFRAHTLLDVRLETGRTHQIRVHLAEIRYPVFGDPVYGGRLRLPSGMATANADIMRGFRRQALHARRLSLEHPLTGVPMQWERSVPDDMATLLNLLRQDREEHGA